MGLITGFVTYGNTITEVLNAWAEFGVFAYLLPFLMIFAVVFGLLNKSEILGKNKGVQATISLAFGLLALQFDYVPNFFASIFPYAGIGLSVMLVALILMGFIEGEKWGNKVWFGIGIVVFVVVFLYSISDASWISGRGYMWAEAWPLILLGLMVLGILALIIWGSKKST